MIEMPPLQFADTNGIRMGFYEAGPETDNPPVVLCHGWPEMAFSWRHQIKALEAAGIRVIAPDQRGYGATDRPDRSRPTTSSTSPATSSACSTISGSRRRSSSVTTGAALSPGRCRCATSTASPAWSGSTRPMPTARRPTRSSCSASASATRCISSSFRIPPAAPTRFSTAGSSRPSMPSCASRCRARQRAARAAGRWRRCLAADQPGVSQMIAGYDASTIRARRSCRRRRSRFRRHLHRTGFTGGINWYRNMSRNWQRSAELDHTVNVPSLMIMAENDRCCRRPRPMAWRRSSPTSKISGARQRPLDAAGKAGRGQRQAD